MTCSFSIRKKFHMQRRRISISPVRKGRKVDLGIRRTTDGEIVRVQEQRKMRLRKMAM